MVQALVPHQITAVVVEVAHLLLAQMELQPLLAMEAMGRHQP